MASCQPLVHVSHQKPRFHPPAGHPAARAVHAADHTSRRDPGTAIAGYLRAAKTAAESLRDHPGDTAAREAANFALSRVFGILRDHDLQPWSEPLTAGEFTLDFRADTATPLPPAEFRFLPTDELDTSSKGFPKPAHRDGLGATLVAVRRNNNDPKPERSLSTRFVCSSVTAVPVFQGNRCSLVFRDPFADETIRVDGRELPLAGDFTTAPAIFFQHERPDKLRLISLFRPYDYVHTTALYRLQPYDPQRIPVVLIHGMQDTPATWMPMYSRMVADPDVRRRCQFWFFAYPSGYPYPYSAMLLREKLDLAAQAFPDHQPIVLVGHSLGGLIARLMVLDSGEQVWRALFPRGPAQTPLLPQDRKHLEGSLIFQHRPDVARVVYLSAPHHGTIMASNWIGRNAARLVQLPGNLLSLGQDLLSVAALQQSGLSMRRIPNCIDTMAPDHPFNLAVNRLPPVRTIPFHQILADRGRGNSPDSDDGVVTYRSCHLDGAASECIIPGDHMTNQHPAAAAELRRILLLHAGKK